MLTTTISFCFVLLQKVCGETAVLSSDSQFNYCPGVHHTKDLSHSLSEEWGGVLLAL